jgi:hypothetical protein
MDKGCRGVRQHSRINITAGFAAGASDFQQRVTAVDRLVDRRRGIDWLPIRPHALVPALAQEAIGLFDQCLTFGTGRGGLRCQNSSHRACLADLFAEGFSVATG